MKRYLKTPEEVIDALQAGKTLYDEVGAGSKWRLYKGVLIRRDNDGYSITNAPIHKEWNVYTDEPEPLKLKVGKFYKTRDGRKAWITERDDNYGAFPFKVAAQQQPGFYYVAKDGKRYSDRLDDATDLVAPWEE